MYFSRVRLQTDMQNSYIMGAMISKDGYFSHQLLWKLFPEDPDAQRDFIYRQEYKNGTPVYYLVSKRKPVSVLGLADVETKAYTPAVSQGDHFEFSLRVNPVITRKKGDGKKHKRHDVVMDAKKKLQNIGKPKAMLSEIVATEGAMWLSGRAEKKGFFFEKENLRVDGYHQHCFVKRDKKTEIKFSTIDFQGFLTVSEPDVFVDTLFTGIGRSKAFGCGLLLVRRI
ncbi:MAG: type I-E CRISPR-associated protein Cas6/Cse3/CasE [Dissulfuribacterales bacterium]